MDERVRLYSDPGNPDLPTSPWAGDGRAYEPVDWIRGGVVKNLFYSRYWAKKQNVKAVPAPPNLILAGGTAIRRITSSFRQARATERVAESQLYWSR